MSCAGMSRLTFPSLQFSYPESDRDRRVAVLVRPLIKRSTAFSSRPRPAMAAAMAVAAVGAKEGRKERKNRGMGGRTALSLWFSQPLVVPRQQSSSLGSVGRARRLSSAKSCFVFL